VGSDFVSRTVTGNEINSKLSEQKTEKHVIQMLNSGGGLKADENWMSADLLGS